MAIGPILGGVSAITPLFDYLRPRRSPYLIPTALIGLLLGFRLLGLSSEADFEPHSYMFYIPIIGIFALFAYLSMRYRDPTLVGPVNDAKIIDEIDGQLKFARAMGVATGVAMLYYLYAEYGYRMLDFPVLLLYAVILVHLVTFVAYMALYNIREEHPAAHAFFQVGALTSIALAVLTIATVTIEDGDGGLAVRCETGFLATVEARETIFDLKDDEGEPRDATPEEIAAAPLVVLTNDLESSSCQGSAPDVSPLNFEVYDLGFRVISVERTSEMKTYLDERFVVAAAFLAIWTAFEVFWLVVLGRLWQRSQKVFSRGARAEDGTAASHDAGETG